MGYTATSEFPAVAIVLKDLALALEIKKSHGTAA